MARKKHLINVHTSTGTTAPTNASLYLGEIAVQHTPNDPGLWIKMGTAESSTEYEKFIGKTEINNEFHKTNHNIPFVEQSGNIYTGTTSAYTAECNELDELVDGQSIIFFTKQGSTTGTSGTILNSCTLDLTLADGTKTGPKIIYLEKNAKLTTHLEGANCIRLTYRENATWSGVTGLSGWWTDYFYDANTDVQAYALRYNNAQRVTTSQMYRYRLMFTSADKNYWVPANSATSTNATAARAAATTPIDPFGPIAYYATTTAINSGASPGSTAVYTQYSAVTLGYSFVFANSAMTAKLPVYLKCEPQGDGSAIIDATTPIVQSLPNEEDGKIYIFLGVAVNATVFELYEQHPIYEYKGGHVRHYQEGEEVEMILGSGYTYSGLPYVNSATTLADAYSALTNEMLEDEKVVATALNDLNDRIDEISAATGDNAELLEYLQENEEVVAGALNNLNERVGTVETHMTGDYIPITGYQTATGTTEEELTLTDEDTVNEALGKLQKQMLDNEESIAAGLNDLNTRLENVDDVIAHNTGVTQLSGAVRSFSAATYDGLNEIFNKTYSLSSATQSLSSATISLSGAVMGISAKTSGVLTVNLNGVLQGRYSPSASTTINLTAATEVTGADVLLTGYELATGTTEEELAIVATDTVNEAFGKIQKQNYDNEAVVAGALNDLDERTIAISGAVVSNRTDINTLSASLIDDELVIAASLNDLNSRTTAISGTVKTISDAVETIRANYVTAITSASTNSEYPTAKAVYDEVHPVIITTGGTAATITIEPNVLYNFGALTGTKTFTLATPGDSSVVNHYYWTFDTSTTAPTITWPSGLTWYGGNEPTVAANSHYEVSVLNGIAVSMEI